MLQILVICAKFTDNPSHLVHLEIIEPQKEKMAMEKKKTKIFKSQGLESIWITCTTQTIIHSFMVNFHSQGLEPIWKTCTTQTIIHSYGKFSILLRDWKTCTTQTPIHSWHNFKSTERKKKKEGKKAKRSRNNMPQLGVYSSKVQKKEAYSVKRLEARTVSYEKARSSKQPNTSTRDDQKPQL